MKLFWIILNAFLLTFLAESSLLAQSKKQKSRHEIKKSGRLQSYKYRSQETSRAVRAKKSMGISAKHGLPGLGEFAPGVEFSKLFSSDLQLAGSVHIMNKDYASDINDSDSSISIIEVNKAEVKGQVAYLQGRYFTGNSFFFGAGTGYRQYKTDLKFSERFRDKGFSTQIKSQSYLGLVNIGNHWSFANGILIGAEWIGWAQPLASTHSVSHSDNYNDEELSQNIKDIEAELADKFADSGFIYMNVSLGYQF